MSIAKFEFLKQMNSIISTLNTIGAILSYLHSKLDKKQKPSFNTFLASWKHA